MVCVAAAVVACEARPGPCAHGRLPQPPSPTGSASTVQAMVLHSTAAGKRPLEVDGGAETAGAKQAALAAAPPLPAAAHNDNRPPATAAAANNNNNNDNTS